MCRFLNCTKCAVWLFMHALVSDVQRERRFSRFFFVVDFLRRRGRPSGRSSRASTFRLPTCNIAKLSSLLFYYYLISDSLEKRFPILPVGLVCGFTNSTIATRAIISRQIPHKCSTTKYYYTTITMLNKHHMVAIVRFRENNTYAIR